MLWLLHLVEGYLEEEVEVLLTKPRCPWILNGYAYLPVSLHPSTRLLANG